MKPFEIRDNQGRVVYIGHNSFQAAHALIVAAFQAGSACLIPVEAK